MYIQSIVVKRSQFITYIKLGLMMVIQQVNWELMVILKSANIVYQLFTKFKNPLKIYYPICWI